jgi:hypothetical protein
MLLLLKLTLAPLLVALATLATRRWGPKIGGFVVGLPLSTGPIFLFLAIDRGLDFAETACVGILFGLVGLAGFALVHAAVSRRAGWAPSLVFSAIAYFIISVAVSGYVVSEVVPAGVAAYVALLLAALVICRPQSQASRSVSPWWDICFRMLVAAALTVSITAAAEQLGPVFSGIVGTFPVVTTVVVTFTHHQWGRDAAIAMLRGSVLSWIALVSCFLATGLVIKPFGLAASLGLGALAAVGTTILVLWVDGLAASRTRNTHALVASKQPK